MNDELFVTGTGSASHGVPKERYVLVSLALLATLASVAVLIATWTHPDYVVWKVSQGYLLAVIGTVLSMAAYAEDVRRSGHPDYRRRFAIGVDVQAAWLRVGSFLLGLGHTFIAALDAAR